MFTNTTTSVVTTVSGLPPLFSVANTSSMTNRIPSTQNSLREHEGLGGGSLGREIRHPFRGSEEPTQDSTQYQFLGLGEPVVGNQYSSPPFQPEGATGPFGGHAYSSNTQQYPITGGTKQKDRYQDPRLLQNNYNYLEVQQAINTNFPSAVVEVQSLQKGVEDRMLWLDRMLQWQSEELSDVYKWIERDFEESDEMTEIRAPGDRTEENSSRAAGGDRGKMWGIGGHILKRMLGKSSTCSSAGMAGKV